MPIAITTALKPERTPSVPGMARTLAGLKRCPSGSSSLIVSRPVIFPALPRILLTRIRPLTSMSKSIISLRSLDVSGISDNFSSIKSSTCAAPHSRAVTAQSSAVAPPPITATRPVKVWVVGFERRSTIFVASCSFSIPSSMGFHNPAVTQTAAYPCANRDFGSSTLVAVLALIFPSESRNLISDSTTFFSRR